MQKIILSRKEEEKVIKMYCKDGESALTIQKKTKINYKKVYRILSKYGVKTRSPREKTLNAIKQGRSSNSELQRKVTSEKWKGENNPRYKHNGSERKSHGYVLIKIAENTWIEKSRYIAEKELKRKLTKEETIHHINGKKNDNRKENLYLMTRKEHKAWHTLDNINSSLKDKRPKLISNI